MKPINIVLTFLILFLVSFILLCFSEAPALVTGNIHPTFKSMLIGGGDIQGPNGQPILAFMFGFSIICLLCSFSYLGASNNGKLKHYRPHLLSAFFIYLVVFVWQFISHKNYITTGHQDFFGGWPTPTAVMIYAMWSAPGLIVLVFIFNFKRHILSDEDEARFKAILENRKLNESNL